jgi:hypothetical protein
MNFFFGIGKRSLKTFYISCLQSRNQLVTSPRKGLILIAESEEERQQMKHLRIFEASKNQKAYALQDIQMSSHDKALRSPGEIWLNAGQFVRSCSKALLFFGQSCGIMPSLRELGAVMLRLVFSAALSGSKEAPFREMW